MRLITTKDTNNPPTSLLNAKAEQERIAINQDIDSISEKIYKGNKATINDIDDPHYGMEEFEIRYKLRRLFHNKCAYCECREYKPDVEHYRPKKRVTGNQRNNHGYYWLCYEWTNLLPACSACNSGNGKWNKFPIAGNRVITPPITASNNLAFDKCKVDNDYLQSELPLLLQPEIDDPTNFLKLEWNGKLTAIDGANGRGKTSIDTYDLNRGNLIFSRKKILDDLKENIDLVFRGLKEGYIDMQFLQAYLKIRLDKFKAKSVVSTPYSFVYFYISENFSAFVADNFPNFVDVETQLLIESFPVEA